MGQKMAKLLVIQLIILGLAYGQDGHESLSASSYTISSHLKPLFMPNVKFLELNGEETVKRSKRFVVDDNNPPDFPSQVDISQEKINETLSKNVSSATFKDFDSKYYESSHVEYNKFWVDLDAQENQQALVEDHKLLSQSYRRAATIKLTFPFPFYGHKLQTVTIATGGFLYTGEYAHSWLAATQYIAPLMANFDTSRLEKARIRYMDNGTALVVEWRNVYLQETDNDDDYDNFDNATNAYNDSISTTTTSSSRRKDTVPEDKDLFTFQAILHSTGDIIFCYKSVPKAISDIEDDVHPVKVGLSDAYIMDKTILFVRRKTIYEYHRINLKSLHIVNETAIRFKALPTCNRENTCSSCLGVEDRNPKLECYWCAPLSMCSDGLDRNRQDWVRHKCALKNFNSMEKCFQPPRMRKQENANQENVRPKINDTKADENREAEKSFQSLSHTHYGLIILFLLFLLTIAWFVYAYLFPYSQSGQLLIKYRPAQVLTFFRKEPCYTAASIHM